MKFYKTIISLIFVILLFNNIYADSLEEIFQEGIKLYKEKKYKEASEKFEIIFKQGRINGELCYNLGNCYYRLGNTGNAILFYEKTKKYLGNDPDLLYNLEIANSTIQNPILIPPKLFFIKWWNFLLANTPLQYLGFSALLLALIVLILSFFKVHYSDKSFSIMFQFIRKLAVGLFVFILVLTGLKIHFIKNNSFAIILDKKSPLKSEPFDESKDLIYIPEGTKVKIKRFTDKWIEIELPDGNKGWIHNEQAGII